MQIHYELPSEKLEPYVRNYFFVESLPGMNISLRFKLFPIGNPHIIFYKGGETILYIDGKKFKCKAPTLNSQFYQFYELALAHDAAFFGITFYTTGFYKLLGINAQSIANKLVLLSDYIEAPDYIQEITVAKTDTEVVAAHEQFLLSKIEKIYEIPHIIDLCIEKIVSHEGNTTVDHIAKTHKCSRRYLEKHFAYSVGMSPGKYIKRIRFFSVMKKIIMEQANIEKILAYFNYYDLSHFMKDFEYFMGEKPQHYFQNNHPLLNIIIKEDCLFIR